ncbi:hypothetical protein [Arthrobacter flavus]|uniref:Uncharacterized protein n=1 Tax=Arthrobacter flavus TaxID=95172 RepID=A0ABW4Q160_9MICC
MALGRHSAEPVKRQKPANDLLAWGVFISVACLGSIWVLDLDPGPGLLLSAMPAAAFGVVWILTNGALTPHPAGAHSAQRQLAPTAPSAALGTTAPAATPEPALPARARPAHERPASDASIPTAASRWVQEFGPPDTGPLPVQTYRRNRGSGVFAGSVEQRSDGRQWSHSRA